MNNFDDSIARMKALYSYGTVNENKKQSTSTLEYSAKAADGKTYGIVKECNHFYIKQASNGKEKLAEGYEYIGGFMNKNNYKYDSYANALKNFELKLASINEAHDAKVDITTLDPFKKENIIAEASDKMKAEIARQRQIMYNASMIMNESADYAVKGGAACSTSQPEAETGAKGDKMEGSKEAKADPDYKGSNVGLDKKAEPFDENPSKSKDLKEGCEGGSCDTDFDNGMDKGRDPKEVGWDMEGQQKVNEEGEKEWDKGLPSGAGVGEADTDHNNDPFNKTVNEDVEDELGDVDLEGEDDFDFGDDDFDFEDEESVEGPEGEEDIDVDVEGGEDELGDEDLDVDVDIEGDELGDELGNEPALEDDDEAELVDESDPESVKAEIERLQNVLADLEGDEPLGDEPLGDEPALEDEPLGDEPALEDEPSLEDESSLEDEPEHKEGDDFSHDDVDEGMFEAKQNFMNSIVESVVKSLLKEDELHDFGKHPGYRKKPMDLPPTGEDKNEHGEDWNDESVHSEEPFGSKIGDSSPFNELVNAVTKDVMYQLKHGVKLDNKKKAE